LPLFSASTRSSSTTTFPRAVFTMTTPSFIFEKAFLSSIPFVSGVSGRWIEM
jgi:hypothetical protein